MRSFNNATRYLRIAWYFFVILLTLEMVARIDDFVREDAAIFAPFNFDSTLQPGAFGREGRPGAHYGKWSFNSLGYRGPEIDSGLSTIMTFGASETFGIHESIGQEYPRQLQRILADRYSKYVNVVNIAIPGMRHGRVGYLERALGHIPSSLVVIYPSPANYIGVHQPYCDIPTQPVSPDSGFIRHIRMVDKAEQLIKRLAPPRVRSYAEDLSVRRREKDISVMMTVPETSVSAFRRDLECAVEVAQRRGVKVLLVTHATYFGNHYQEGDKRMLVAWRYFYPSLAATGFLDLENRANAAVREVAKKYGTEIVDAAELMPRGPDYFSDFVHFSDRGARHLSEMLAQKVSEALQDPPTAAAVQISGG